MKKGTLIIKGKTKEIYHALSNDGDEQVKDANTGDDLVIVASNDDITAGDGAKHDIIEGKAVISTATTVAIFKLLRSCGIPLAFIDSFEQTSFIARKCAMLPYEVIVRREAHGSFLQRCPHLQRGHRFPKLLVEFFLKTSGRTYEGHDLVCDDPLMQMTDVPGTMRLFNPHVPAYGTKPFLELPTPEGLTSDMVKQMADIAAKVFLILEKSWQQFGMRFVDYKVEFGLTTSDELVLSDVIDADSGRVVGPDGKYLDKQVYREGGSIEEVYKNFLRIQHMAESFHVPSDSVVIVWSGSEKDNLQPFQRAFEQYGGSSLKPGYIMCSAHKEPARTLEKLQAVLRDSPHAVIIAYVGRSNGLGPILAANSPLTVICVPASAKEFPDDVWSSLRMPSNVPCSTILEPVNAIQHAMQIHAMRNPDIYARLISSKPDFYEIG